MTPKYLFPFAKKLQTEPNRLSSMQKVYYVQKQSVLVVVTMVPKYYGTANNVFSM